MKRGVRPVEVDERFLEIGDGSISGQSLSRQTGFGYDIQCSWLAGFRLAGLEWVFSWINI